MLGLATAQASCGLELDAQRVPTVAVFDPSGGNIPMPNDILRDESVETLDLPTDDPSLSETEVAFREWMNTRNGWSSAQAAVVSFSDAVEVDSITNDTVQVWSWGEPHRRVEDVRLEVSEADRRLTILPPREGWVRGERYVIVLRGGEDGVLDSSGYPVEPDSAFYFLRSDQVLTDPAHQRAFPGASRAEREAAAEALEEIRESLIPYFEFFEADERLPISHIPREEVASLWTFTTSRETEVAMDRDSQRVPIPFDLLINPETGLVELAAAPWDTELEASAKRVLNELDGFGVSANLLFELTAAVDPATVSEDSVALYELGEDGRLARQIPLSTRVMAESGVGACAGSPVDEGCVHIVIDPEGEELPLRPHTRYAVVLTERMRALDGSPVVPMPLGWMLTTPHPIARDGRSQISLLSDELAARVEGVRREVAPLLEEIGRSDVIAAWPFTTMDTEPEIRRLATLTSTLGEDTQPRLHEDGGDQSPGEALERLSPGILGAAVRGVYQIDRTRGVDRFMWGTLKTPYFLDPVTRRWRDDGLYEMTDIEFVFAVPERRYIQDRLDAGEPIPTMIFGHAVVTDRRFLMTIAGELARRGIASVAIDFPFHGERIACHDASLIAIPNFFGGAILDLIPGITIREDGLISMYPCAAGEGATCTEDGQCATASGAVDEFAELPIIAVQPASGAAFLDVGDLPHIPDHFRQALVDLSTLMHSLHVDDWESVVGIRPDTDQLYYSGQSLGSIIGAVWLSGEPRIKRAVLNVPGSDMVDLFQESTYFSPQLEAYFEGLGIPEGSYEQERLLNVARWLVDTIDPQAIAHLMNEEDRDILLQMDEGDIIIPNTTTRTLERVSGRPMRSYPSALHGDLVAPLVGDAALRDLGAYIAGEIDE